MQLNRRRRGRLIAPTLGLLTANLFAAVGVAHAQDPASSPPPPSSINDDTQTDLGKTRIDSTVLFYQEAGGRVRAIEPVIGATMNSEGGDALSVKLTADSLTGATPNGAAPWTAPQTFITPAHAPGTNSTVTTASGNSKIVTIPGTGTVAREYTVPANTLPVDAGFHDHRFAIDVGYSTLLGSNTHFSFGGAGSVETDYWSESANIGIAQDLNQKNTTLALSANLEFDQSRPYFGTPTPFTVMSANDKGPNDSKTVISLVAGVTQVITRHWLMQLNYSWGSGVGYQTDPYRVISVVDPVSGAPLNYLYENRPRTRTRQSIYWGNKIAIGPTVLDLSGRLYKDSWSIKSTTFDAAERIPLFGGLYVEPRFRWYSQTAADFFRNYLINGQPLPEYASSDSRLGKFSATTIGLRLGLKVGETGELYLQGEDYKQTGTAHPANAVGALSSENLFSGIRAASVIVGYTFAFE